MNIGTSANLYEPITLLDNSDIILTITHDSRSYYTSHWHNGLELIYLLDGSLEVSIEDKNLDLKKDDCIVINPRIIHSTKCVQGNSAILLQLPDSFLKKYIPEISSIYFDVPVHTENKVICTKLMVLKELLQKIQILFLANPSGMALRLHGLLFELLYQLYHNFKTTIIPSLTTSQYKNREKLELVINYTESHYTQPISIDTIASVAGFQPKYFCRFFKNNMGKTYLKFLNELRLSHIYQDLLITDYPVYQLMEKHGFTNYKLFYKMFMELFHATPKELRQSRK